MNRGTVGRLWFVVGRQVAAHVVMSVVRCRCTDGSRTQAWRTAPVSIRRVSLVCGGGLARCGPFPASCLVSEISPLLPGSPSAFPRSTPKGREGKGRDHSGGSQGRRADGHRRTAIRPRSAVDVGTCVRDGKGLGRGRPRPRSVGVWNGGSARGRWTHVIEKGHGEDLRSACLVQPPTGSPSSRILSHRRLS